MPVIPCSTNPIQDEKELHQFLLVCQEKSIRAGSSLIVSFSIEIDPIDPLAVLQNYLRTNERHFYWENRGKGEAIAAWGTAASLTITSSDRFTKSQQFVQKCCQQIIKTGDLHLPLAGPHFLAAFTFFDYPENRDRCVDLAVGSFPAATIFLPEFHLACRQEKYVFVANFQLEAQGDINLIINRLQQQIQKTSLSRQPIINLAFDPPQPLIQQLPEITAHKFTSAVSSALSSIQKKEFSKIVLAHALDVTAPVNFQLVESLHNLRQRHPDCYIFSISNGKKSNFIGASPERLISIHNHQLATDALAGSAPRGKTTAEDVKFADKLLNSEKEKREHQAVSKFIIQQLNKIGLQPTISPLQVLQLSNIQHLWTPIYAQLSSEINPLEIVAQLHPTPAVAGVPTAIACEQIRRYESCDRCLYAAPLGWLDDRGNAQFIVGIRSAMITENWARLYAGAGIVAGSDPQKELAEVQLKLQTMLNALI
ncbi:isochorismate synthase [Oscillatoria salina]|uniref:isochorismate synthase n=1 Tax=Oscillatoria salina TaxID=331517 RepID=UPI001CCA66FE|nr:isochorismate synthase [Oscillatoria salina]MBZ8182838.1 isochorismate synthase [Oscillatoria salina IIICB1]